MSRTTNKQKTEEKILTNDQSGSSVKTIKERRKRVPLSDRNRLINVKQDPNYSYRLVNDLDDRLTKFYNAGYEFVDRNGEDIDIDGRIQDPSWRQSAVSQHVGQGVIAFLMRIPKEWWEQEQKNKQDEITRREKFPNIQKATEVASKDFYGEISIDHSFE